MDWFVTAGAEPPPGAARVFCFPHAGGSPRLFLGWQPALGGDAQVLAVCRPGREHRAHEPAPTIEEYIDGAAAAIRAVSASDDRPVYLFGHSLGALVAFEVTRRLAGLPTLRHLVASGCSAPSLLPSQRVRDIAGLEGKAFAEAIVFFGGLPAEVVADDELRELLLPGLIADFHMAVGYRYRPAEPLPVGLSLICGRDDPHVGPAQLEPWRDEVKDAPACHWADGGHFYFERGPEAAIDLLLTLVRADHHVELI
ncbi:MAG TPA: alpha/beta fold hydrolase [Streptosporangiaceae bacterium]